MHALRTIKLGVRLQAGIVLALGALWHWSLLLSLRDIKVDRLSLFWDVLLCLLPLTTVILSTIMLASYSRSGRPHRWWVRAAVLLTLSPWLLFLFFLASQADI